MHVDGSRIWLRDLDLHAEGVPAIDLGSFLTHLDEYGLRRLGDPCTFHAQASAFLAGYARVRALPPPDRIAALRAVSLARHIHISARFATRHHTTRRLISLSLAALSGTQEVST